MRTIMFAIILILSSAPLNAQMMDGALYDVDALRKEQNRQRQEMEKQRSAGSSARRCSIMHGNKTDSPRPIVRCA